VYVFPAPEKAAVTGLVIETGGRRITGCVKEKEAAFEEYDEALAPVTARCCSTSTALTSSRPASGTSFQVRRWWWS